MAAYDINMNSILFLLGRPWRFITQGFSFQDLFYFICINVLLMSMSVEPLCWQRSKEGIRPLGLELEFLFFFLLRQDLAMYL